MPRANLPPQRHLLKSVQRWPREKRLASQVGSWVQSCCQAHLGWAAPRRGRAVPRLLVGRARSASSRSVERARPQPQAVVEQPARPGQRRGVAGSSELRTHRARHRQRHRLHRATPVAHACLGAEASGRREVPPDVTTRRRVQREAPRPGQRHEPGGVASASPTAAERALALARQRHGHSCHPSPARF